MTYFVKTGLIVVFIIILIPILGIIDAINTKNQTIKFLQNDNSFLQKQINRIEPYESKYLSLQKEYRDFINEAAEWQRIALDKNN